MGVQFAQLLHSAGESFIPNCRGSPTYAVALAANSEEELLKLEARLIRDNIPHTSIREPDKPFCGQLMAIGLEPASKNKLKKYTSSYKLLG